MILVIGSRGRIGRAIMQAYETSARLAPSRSEYSLWASLDGKGTDAARRYLTAVSELVEGRLVHVFVTSGILNKNAGRNAHMAVNYALPAAIIEAARGLNLHVVTFGTIMETFEGLQNDYIDSKRALAALVKARVSDGQAISHFQIHTVYGGGLPSPSMFLGQMLESLVAEKSFAMSDGTQLREYHHVDDDVTAIKAALDKKLFGQLSLSHGSPVQLRALANSVFQALGRQDLLEVGKIPTASGENLDRHYRRPSYCEHVVFRDALQAVPAYISDCLHGVMTSDLSEQRVTRA